MMMSVVPDGKALIERFGPWGIVAFLLLATMGWILVNLTNRLDAIYSAIDTKIGAQYMSILESQQSILRSQAALAVIEGKLTRIEERLPPR